MKKKRIQNIGIIIITISVIGTISLYTYVVEKTRQEGMQFGMDLEQIQNDVKELQTKFYSEKIKWEEDDISKKVLLEFYNEHLKNFNKTISRYDELMPPELFKSSVDLLKISSQTQLQSDYNFIEWIKTGDESAKIRSDNQIQKSLEYEMSGLVEYYSAKTGVKKYAEPEKFATPQRGLTQKVITIHDSMKNDCNEKYTNKQNEFNSDKLKIDWQNCIDESEQWKIDHLP